MTIETTIGKSGLPVTVWYDYGPAIPGSRYEPDEPAWCDIEMVGVAIGKDRHSIMDILDDDVIDHLAESIIAREAEPSYPED